MYAPAKRIVDNIIVFMLIMSTGGLLFVFNRNLMYLIFTGILVFSVVYSTDKTRRRVFNSVIFSVIVFGALFWLNYCFAISDQALSKYLYYMVVIVVSSLSLFHFLNNRDGIAFQLSLYFVLKILVIHAFIQVIAYLSIGDMLHVISTSDYECTTFNYLFYYASTDVKKYSEISLFGLDIIRNQGLFWEAGVAQLFFNIFFFLEAFIMKRNKLLMLITIFVIITTYSTTGIIILLIQMTYYVLSQSKSKSGIIVLLIAFFAISSVVIFNIQEKTIGDKQASFQKRYFDLVQPFFIALEHPITGVGLDLYKFQEYRSQFYIKQSSYRFLEENIGLDLKMETTSEGSSNSFMYILAAMGFPIGLFIIFLFIRQQIIKEKRVLFLLILCLSLFSSPLLLRPFFIFFILSGFVYFCLRFVSSKH